MAMDEVECIIHETVLAAVTETLGVAIDELLLGKGDKVAGRQLREAFYCRYGRECPAARCVCERDMFNR